MSRYTLCPYFEHGKRKSRITCEDTYRWFDSDEEKSNWMDMYCDNEWTKCPYAIELNEVYERLEKGDEKALENHKIEAMEKELKSMATKLGTAEKKLERAQKRVDELTAINKSFISKNEDLEKQKRSYYEKYRKADTQLKEFERKIPEQLTGIVLMYEQRMSYLIENFVPGRKLFEEDVKEWAGDKEFALTSDYEDNELAWKVVFKEDESNECEGIPGDDTEPEPETEEQQVQQC